MKRNLRAFIAFTAAFWLVLPVLSSAQTTWQRPPQDILDVLHAPDLPGAILSPTGETMILVQALRYPPVSDLAQPMLKLAGVRINPKTNGMHADTYYIEMTLKRVADGREIKVELPQDARVNGFLWSADGQRFSFNNRTEDAVELWVCEAATGAVRRISGLRLNPVLGWPVTWMPDQKSLIVKQVAPDRGAPPEIPTVPDGPRVQESSGSSASSTYEARDVLNGPADETLFAYYGRSQLALIDALTGQVTPVGASAMIADAEPSPDGRYLLVDTIQKPWDYAHAWDRFPRNIEVWDLKGTVVHTLAHLPLADQVPIQGVAEGPRSYTWMAMKPSTLLWIEALDGGDPGRKVDFRDRVMTHAVPTRAMPLEIYKAPNRVTGLWWGEKDGLMLIGEYERERRWRTVTALNVGSSKKPRRIFDLSANEKYADPGYPLQKPLPNGRYVLLQEGDDIFLSGAGATPDRDRPFLDRFSLATLKSERLFRCDREHYERFVTWLDVTAGTFLTRSESPTEVPNYEIRTLGSRIAGDVEVGEAVYASTERPFTEFPDPTPRLRAIQKKIVKYQRDDGTPLSFTLYLPPDYKEGTRLPTILYAYPLEYSDPGTAGQISGTDRQFTRLGGASPLFLVLSGYAVLWNTTMPVIGDPDTAYDTFIEQLVADAKAAIDKAVEMGVTDPERIGVTGHSHGALMTATLLAHSDLFRAGVARSGAYNHTMRPFGFQSERRTLYQATDTYVKLSPVMHADKINEPILIIHGEIDQNPGTIPFQSEKLFDAVRGTGGTTRLVMLPFESHGYISKEGVEQVLAEQLNWFDKYVKNAPAREVGAAN